MSIWTKIFVGDYDGTIAPEQTKEERKKDSEELREKMRKPEIIPPVKIPGNKKDAIQK